MGEQKLISEDDKKVFTQVADIAKELRELAMRTGSFRMIDWYTERLNVLTGDFMYLSTRSAEVHAACSNNEIIAYIKEKMDTQASGDKFVSAVAERTARSTVCDLVEAEKVLESYKEASEQGILTCKKIIDILTIELERETK